VFKRFYAANSKTASGQESVLSEGLDLPCFFGPVLT